MTNDAGQAPEPPAEPYVTVAVCTHNRAHCLKRTLDCMSAMRASRPHEVLVVDNHSTDGTRDVVEATDATNASLRYVYEDQLGLSHALNRAISEARGDIIAFKDDDQTVNDGWLEAVVQAFEDDQTDLIFSRSYPVDEEGTLVNDPSLRFPICDYGEEPIVFTRENSEELIFGTGMTAYRLSTLRNMGDFRTDLGRKGKRLVAGEDNDMTERFLRHDCRIMYWPDAIAYHHIDAHRTTWRYAVIKAYDVGITYARREHDEYRRFLFGVPLYCYRKMFRAIGGFVVSPLGGREALSKAWLLLCFTAGNIIGHATYRFHRPRDAADAR